MADNPVTQAQERQALGKALGGAESNPLLAKAKAFDVRFLIGILRANLWLIALVTLGAGLVAVAVTLLQTPRYTAQAAIQINNTGGRVLKGQDDNQGEEAGNAYDTDRFLKTQIDILKSRGLAQRVAQRLNLAASPRFFVAQGSSAPKPEAGKAVAADKLIKLLDKSLVVDLPRDSRIASIRFTSANPELARDIANAYASELIKSNLQRKFDSSAYARDFIANQLAEVKQRLEESERNLNGYARSAGLIRMPDAKEANGQNSGGSVTTASLIQLNAAANEAKAKRLSIEARWRSVSNGPLLSATEIVSNAGISALLAQKATISEALQSEKARHLDDYPTVRAKQSELAVIDQQIAASATSIRNAIKAEYAAAQSAETELAAQVNHLKSETLSEQDKNVQYRLIEREVDTNREVYAGLLQRYKELNASSGISLSNVSIIDYADAPIKPSSPDLVSNVLIGLVLGLGLALVVVFAREQFDDTVHTPEEMEAKLGLRLLGLVPLVRKGNPERALADSKSSLNEAYNSLRGTLLYSAKGGLPQVIQVTSAQPAEGKTTTSVALAIGFARIGRSVLLIDADMRRPAVHRHFDSDNARGLSDVLAGDATLADVVFAGGTQGLSVVTAGPVPDSPSELLAGTRCEHLLQEAAKSYDLVLIDSPPVLGLADAPLIGALADGVLFVVAADQSRNGSLRASLRRLEAMQPIVLGGVLTKFDAAKASGRSGNSYDYYQYQYGYGVKK